jgi:hypothetical protein
LLPALRQYHETFLSCWLSLAEFHSGLDYLLLASSAFR